MGILDSLLDCLQQLKLFLDSPLDDNLLAKVITNKPDIIDQ